MKFIHAYFTGMISPRISISGYQHIRDYGVPQGSDLGPLLCLIDMNDIVNCSDLRIFVLLVFADDTNTFVPGNSKVDAYNNANFKLECV